MLSAGSTIGIFIGAEVDREDDSVLEVESVKAGVGENSHGSGIVLGHCIMQSHGSCCESEESQILPEFPTKYSAVFSTGDGDVGRTALVEHSLPLIGGTRTSATSLTWTRERSQGRVTSDLSQKGLIESASGAWSSPVVLISKKDGKWCFCVDYRCMNALTRQDPYPLSWIPRI